MSTEPIIKSSNHTYNSRGGHMHNKKIRFLIILLWGTGVYTLQSFVENPEKRVQIITTILVAFVINFINQFATRDRIYKNRLILYTLPIIVMNLVLLPLNLLAIYLGKYTLTSFHIVIYLVFNLFVLLANILQHVYRRKRINDQLQIKLENLQ